MEDTNNLPTVIAKTTAKDFFLHLASVITLYVSTISLINLLFDVINTAFPDRLSYYPDPYSNSLRLSVAALIILFPLYLILMRLINRGSEHDFARRDIAIKRWLTFLTLFLTGAAIAVDLIVLINTFLGGEVTVRFSLKVLVVLAITGLIFGYYLYELRSLAPKLSVRRVFRYGTITIVALSIIGAFAFIGSPFTQRMKRFDLTRVNDLQNIQNQVINFWQRKGVLPDKIASLEDSISGYTNPTDPSSGNAYDYQISGEKKFILCATFDLSNKDSVSTRPAGAMYYDGGDWPHDAGRFCFDKTIDSDLYPIYDKTAPRPF